MNKTLTVLVCIMVAGVVVGASLPIFDSLTASSESVHNDGAGWVRFTLDRNAGTEYTVTISEDENGVYVTNGSDVQTYDDSSTTDFETILYADSNLSVWCDSAACHVMGVKDGVPQYYEGMDAVTIVRDANGVTVTPEGGDSLSFDVPTWAYIPVSNGNYGFFAYDEERGVQNYPSDMPLAVVGGGNVGVYAYNDIYRYNGLGLGMDTIYDDDGLFYGASWSKTAASDESLSVDPLDPAVIDLTPIDIDLDPLDPGAQIMSVPTPTYTDGDWGYDLENVNGISKAIIVSYSGAGGDIVVPATIGGYEVYRFGKLAPQNVGTSEVIPVATPITSLTFSNGISYIGATALTNGSSRTDLTGALTIPDSVLQIGRNAFYYCKFTSVSIGNNVEYIGDSAFSHCELANQGILVLPDSLTKIDRKAFDYCTGITGIVFSKNLEIIGDNAFDRSSGITGTLLLPDTLTTVGQSAFSGTSYNIVVVPKSVTTVGSASFGSYRGPSCNNLIIATDVVPTADLFYTSDTAEVLNLSDTVDYSINRYGIRDTATVYDTIGDCFGFIGTVDYQTPGGGSPTQELISMLPLIMVLGLVLVAVGLFIWNRM